MTKQRSYLLPCPFCGDAPFHRQIPTATGANYPSYHVIWCESLKCDVGVEVSDVDLASAERLWNRRYPDWVKADLADDAPFQREISVLKLILELTDLEMRDGDSAREIASFALASTGNAYSPKDLAQIIDPTAWRDWNRERGGIGFACFPTEREREMAFAKADLLIAPSLARAEQLPGSSADAGAAGG